MNTVSPVPLDPAAAAEAVVNAFIASIEAMDVDAAVAYAAEDISYENMPVQPIVGRGAVAQVLRGFLKASTAVEWRILRQTSTSDRVVINERVDRFQLAGGWLELPVAGFFEVSADGLITLWRDYFDMGSYRTQLTQFSSQG